MFKPGTLFIVEKYPIHLFQTKKQLILEWVATKKIWTQIFKRRTTIAAGEAIFFLEEEYNKIPDPEIYVGLTTWKVLYGEEIGYIEYDENNIVLQK